MEIIKQNRNSIKLQAECVFIEIGKYYTSIEQFKTALKGLDTDTFSQSHIEIRKESLKKSLKQAVGDITEKMSEELEKIREFTIEMDNVLGTSELLKNDVTLLSASGGTLDQSVTNNMIKQYIGNRQALLSLGAVFKTYGYTDSFIKDYLVNTDVEINSMLETVKAIRLEPDKNTSSALYLMKKLRQFAETLGVIFDKDMAHYVPSMEDVYLGAMREAAGLIS